MRRRQLISSALLFLTAVIWGTAFAAQSVGAEYVGPWTYVAVRYMFSAIVLLPITYWTTKCSRNKLKDRPPEDREQNYLTGGICCGTMLALSSIVQQAGIRYTSAGKAGFITALYVILVPILGLFIGKRPSKRIWLCATVGLAGLYLISVKENFSIGRGDALVMLCALFFSVHILCVDYFSSKLENLIKLSNLQFLFAAAIGSLGMIAFERFDLSGVKLAIWSLLYAGVFSGAVGYTLQVVAQKDTDPTVASLIMSLESVFSALSGWIILGQVMSRRELLGCVFVFLAVVLAQVMVEGKSG